MATKATHQAPCWGGEVWLLETPWGLSGEAPPYSPSWQNHVASRVAPGRECQRTQSWFWDACEHRWQPAVSLLLWLGWWWMRLYMSKWLSLVALRKREDSVSQSISQSVSQSINQSINQTINQSMHQSIDACNQSTNQISIFNNNKAS